MRHWITSFLLLLLEFPVFYQSLTRLLLLLLTYRVAYGVTEMSILLPLPGKRNNRGVDDLCQAVEESPAGRGTPAAGPVP